MRIKTVGRVEAIAIDGLIPFFHSADRRPPHFHARKPGRWEIRVFIQGTTEETLSFDIKWPGKAVFSANVLRALGCLVAGNKTALMQEWRDKVDGAGKGEK